MLVVETSALTFLIFFGQNFSDVRFLNFSKRKVFEYVFWGTSKPIKNFFQISRNVN